MKKVTVIAFTGFYLALSLGFSLNLHYCGGKLAAMSIVMESPSCCCDADMDSDCCSNASISLEMDMDQQITYPPSWELDLPEAKMMDHSFLVESYRFSPQIITPHFPNPPPLSSQDLRVKLVSLTLYG